MIGFNIFLTFSILFIISLITFIIINYIKKKDFSSLLNKVIITFLVFAIVTFIGLSIFPYMMQQRDNALIKQYNKNIETYDTYTEDYAEAAKKQIEEYSELQKEMASKSSVEQLQFWSKQRDEIANSLSQKIDEYQERILDQKLKINEVEGRIEARKENKWFFGLN